MKGEFLDIFKHVDFPIEKLIGSVLVPNGSGDGYTEAVLINAINLFITAQKELISKTFDRKVRNNAVIVVDSTQSSNMYLSSILAIYFNKWTIYDIRGTNDEAFKYYKVISHLPNLRIIKESDINKHVRKHRTFHIDNSVIWFNASVFNTTTLLRHLSIPLDATLDYVQASYDIKLSHEPFKLGREDYKPTVFSVELPYNNPIFRPLCRIVPNVMPQLQ